MNKKTLLHPILFGLITIIFTVSCDKDFNELGTDIVDDEHFNFDKYTDATVKSFNQKLGPIASNNLPINPLGFYSNPAYGNTKANFVTQLELSSLSPVFNNTNSELYEQLPVVDSVIMNIPYYATIKSQTTTNDVKYTTYRLDSIYGPDASKFKLSVHESGYFLRDLDPSQALNDVQPFYTDQNSDIDNNKIGLRLNNSDNTRENDQFFFDKREHKLKTFNTAGVEITPNPRSAPSMRLSLNKDFFKAKILNAPSGSLSSQTLFKNYFRGIYFKVEDGAPGNMAMLNFKNGTITIYYKEDKITPDNVNTTTVNEYKREVVSKSYALNLTGNTISLLENSNEDPNYLTAANSNMEASKLYLKGGQGSMAVIDLFSTVDTKGYVLNPSFNINLPISPTNQKYNLTGPNGVSDEIDDIKFNGWLINEANLTFYVDKTAMANPAAVEPNRIYLYDLTNKKTLVDYSFDTSTDNLYAKRNKYIFGGILLNENSSTTKQKKDATTDIIGDKGFKYKIRITNHIRNLIRNDSTNVRLGLAVTESIANIGLSKLKTPNSTTVSAPSMSVMNPLGTILYGTNIPVGDPDYAKRLKLEIYYTKP